MASQIELKEFVELQKRELGPGIHAIIHEIEVCSQSIHRWLQYCQYHHFNLVSSTNPSDLMLDRISGYRRKGEIVTVRYVYEANIIAFLNSLHAMLDSFPYLLNLFITVHRKDSRDIKWGRRFVEKYRTYDFYDQLLGLMLDSTFNKVKGYVNTTKHKHLIRIANTYERIEFEEYIFKCPTLADDEKIVYQEEVVPRQDAVAFVTECHDVLIPRFFDLCTKVIDTKRG